MEGTLLALLSIILIDIVLGGDNALVIALATRNLQGKTKTQAIIWGTVGAIVLRIGLTFCAIYLMGIPYVQVVAGFLLLYIAIKLLKGEDENHDLKGGDSFWKALYTIIIADFAMSLDNVLAVAGASGGHTGLMVIGLLISLPIIVWGSQLISKIMEKFPIIITIGSGLLGFVAGEMMMKDKAVGHIIEGWHIGHYTLPIVLAVVVMVVGTLLGKKRNKQEKQLQKAS
jgi:YjbE family integral membrane protein